MDTCCSLFFWARFMKALSTFTNAGPRAAAEGTLRTRSGPTGFAADRPLVADERVRRWFLVPRVGVTGHRWWLLLDRHDRVLVTLRVEGALLDPQSNALQLHSEVVVAIWPARQQF